MDLPKSYIAIEPHPDDALLSFGEYMVRVKPIALITVFTGRNSDKGSKKIASGWGIDYYNLAFPDIDLANPKVKFKPKELKDALERVLKKYNKPILAPLGVYHPAHIYLGRLLRDIIPNNKLFFARDFPHSYKKTAKMPKNIKRIKIIDGLFDEKIKLFKKYYKTQHGLLFYNQQYFKLKPPEEYFIGLSKWWW